MCSSMVHIIFNVLLVGATLMLIVGTFAPGWSTEYQNKITGGKIVVKKGLISWDCAVEAVKDTSLNNAECQNGIKDKQDWEKAVLALLVLSIVACGAAIAWSVVACMMCCCNNCLMPPLPILVLVAFLLDLAGVVTYGVKEQDRFKSFKLSTDAEKVNEELMQAFGYSLYLAAAAALVLLVDFVVGLCLVKVKKVSPV